MPGRILIVDDIATNRLILQAKLAANYYDAIEAADGESALALAESEQPDLILLDAMMPGMDGFEACARLKASPTTTHIPILMLTALQDRADRLRGLEAGADDFLTRPHADMALLVRVSSLIRMKLMIDELRLRHRTSLELGLEGVGSPEAGSNPAAMSVLLVAREDCLAEGTLAGIRTRIGCAVELAEGETAARALLGSNRYDACVIWPELADGEPMRVASHLRARPETRQIPVMMVFPEDRMSQAHLAMEMGIVDYLTYPPDFAELAARLKVQLRRKQYSDRLRNAMDDSLVMAVTDPLTGLYNRRYAKNHLDLMIERCEAAGQALAAMAIDLDRFKTINDAHGHAAGDEVLREFARQLRECVRGIDLVSRIGGEEFLVVMPDISPADARNAAERLRMEVECVGFRLNGVPTPVGITVSIGLAFHRPGEAASAFVARADDALYGSKGGGRNKVTLSAAA